MCDGIGGLLEVSGGRMCVFMCVCCVVCTRAGVDFAVGYGRVWYGMVWYGDVVMYVYT